MQVDRDGNTVILQQEKGSLKDFIPTFKKAYPRFKNDHLILNLFSLGKFSAEDLLKFLPLSDTHRAAGKSFVLVSDALSYDDIPEEISLVPTLQEARDLIEMEEIERDLDL